MQQNQSDAKVCGRTALENFWLFLTLEENVFSFLHNMILNKVITQWFAFLASNDEVKDLNRRKSRTSKWSWSVCSPFSGVHAMTRSIQTFPASRGTFAIT